MSDSQTRRYDGSELWRSLPMMLTALLAVVTAVDIMLTIQPQWLEELSHAWRSTVATRPILAPAANVLAASAALACAVVASAVLLAFVRVARLAPHVSLAPAWVSLCILSVIRVHAPVPLPMSMPLFAALSALSFVGGCTALCSGSRAGMFFGCMMVAMPLVVFARSYLEASRVSYPFGHDAQQLVAGLGASALGVVLLSVMHRRRREVPELDGVDVVEELFAQVERAERSEARVADLERQLNAQTRHQSGSLRRVR